MEWIITTPEMSHSGILGMHWGRRRYQNKDGSWTEAGKRRRREMSPDAKKRADRKNEMKNLKSKGELDTAKANLKITKAQNKAAVQEAKAGVKTLRGKMADKAKAAAVAAKDAAKAKVEERKAAKKEATAEEIIRSGDMKKILQNKDKLSNEQLKAAADRMDLEQRLSGIDAKQKQAGIDKYKRFADVVGTTANLTSNGINIYNNVGKILGTFGIAELPVIDSRANREKAQYDRDANAERLRTMRANADTAEANARRAQQEASSSSSSNQSSTNDDSSSGARGMRGQTWGIRPNNDVNERARQRAAEANARRHQSSEDSNSSESNSSSSNESSSPTLRERIRAGAQQRREQAAERREQQHANRWTQEAQDDRREQALIASRTNQRVRDMRYRAQTSGASDDEIRRLERLERATETIAQYRGNQYAEISRRNPTGQTKAQAARNSAVNAAHKAADALKNARLTREAREANRETAAHRAQQAQQQLDDAFRLIGQTDLDELERRYRTYSPD